MAKITAYNEITTPASTDILYLVSDPGGSPVGKKLQIANLGQVLAVPVAISAVFDGSDAALTTGTVVHVYVPYSGTITAATMIADQTGSLVIDVWKDTYANYPPTAADTITASAKPTISSAIKSQDSTLTGWTTAIDAGDVIAFSVDSVTDITWAQITLSITV